MIQFKPEVRINYLNEYLVEVLEKCSIWSMLTGTGVEVNSIDDSQHGVNTLHKTSLAIDLDTVGDKLVDLRSLHMYLRRNLPKDYDVIFENDHVHVEWDTHRT